MKSGGILPAGQLPADLLQRLLERYGPQPAEAARRAGGGRNAAVIELGEHLLMAKADLLTGVAEDLGHYAVHVNVNAVASMGGEPKWFLATILLPEGTTRARDVENIFQQMSQACETTGVAWQGGRAEITAGIAQPFVAGCLLAEAPHRRRFSPNQLQPGDRIILTKGLAVEATATWGRVQEKALARNFETAFAQKCRQFIFAPGISILPEARRAWEVPGVHALHDLAAGGLANALHELLQVKRLGVEIDWSLIPVFPETKLLCEHFGMDPLGVLASGALLICGSEAACAEVLHRLRSDEIAAEEIGRVLPEGEKQWLLDGASRTPLPQFPRDEILRVFS